MVPRRSLNRNKPESLAGSLIKTIKNGQDKLMKRGTKPDQEANHNHAVLPHIIPNACTNHDFDQTKASLLNLETYYKKKNDKKKMWTAWFLYSCLQLVIEEANPLPPNQHHKHKPFLGARVANLIVNKLLQSDGISAMGVFNILAGRITLPVLIWLWLTSSRVQP